MTPDQTPRRPPEKLPEWFPAWASQLADLYFSATTAAFVLHGNTYDLFRVGTGEGARYGVLAEFLAEQVFGRWSLVLHYDLGQGLRAYVGRGEQQRLKEMVALANRKLGDLSALPKDPAAAFAVLDKFVRGNIMAAEGDRLSLALIIDQASFIFPSGEPGRLNLQASSELVTMLNWAMSPQVKKMNMAFVMVDEKLSDLSERLTGNPHVATIEVPLPAEHERETYIRASTEAPIGAYSDFDARQLASLTAGISLADLNVLIQSARESGKRLDAAVFRSLKKRLLERQCRGLLEFIEPKWTLDTVVGHDAAKARLREDAALLRRGALESLPMGYLLCGPVGTGKSFLAQCVSGEIGAPCVILKNFRSKYVGETEGNLERVLAVLRAMGPVVVVVDEADAALGSREQDGDSGTSSRVFGMIAAQMGDTQYRGRIIWMLLTARPDLLPIDLKRQGRAEVHIPLFYPTEEGEIRQMFVILAGKLGSRLSADDVPPIPQRGQLSGADIEGMVGRAWRTSLLAGADHVTREALAGVIATFMPSTQGLERELQETAAMLECTDSQFLPPAILEKMAAEGGRGKLQARLTALKQIVKDL